MNITGRLPRVPSEQPPRDHRLVDSSGVDNGVALTRKALRNAHSWLVMGSIGSVLISSVNVIVPLALGRAIQDGLVAGSRNALALWLIVIVVVYAVRAWATTFRLHSNVGAAQVEHDLRLQALEKSLARTQNKRLPGDLLTVVVADARTISRAMVAVTSIPGNVITLMGCLIAFWVMDWRLMALVVVCTPPLVLVAVKGIAPVKPRTRIERKAEAQAAGIAADLTAGFRIVQGLFATDRAADRFHQASQQGLQATIHTRRARGLYTGILNVVVGLFTALLTITAALFSYNGVISSGTLVTVVALAQTLAPPLRALGADTATALSMAHASGDRLCEVLVTPEISAQNTVHDLSPVDSLPIQLDGIRTEIITEELSFQIHPGELLGIVAPANISHELADIFNRSVIPVHGHLIVDGRDAASWDEPSYAARLLVSPENPSLFDGTIRDNLVLGRDIPESVIATALGAAAAHSITDSLPAGLDSPVGESGRLLSGGQRQRIALARAIAQANGALVLINPTTSVDAVTEAQIGVGIADQLGRKTTVLITSSPNLLTQADEVIFLGDQGEIIDRGKHSSLLASPDYRRALS